MNLRDTILSARDTRLVPCEVPEWGCTVHLRTWSGTERAKFQAWYGTAQSKPEEVANLMGLVAVLSLCDEDGNRLFNEDDVAALNGKAASALDRVALAALSLNGLGADSVEQAKND